MLATAATPAKIIIAGRTPMLWLVSPATMLVDAMTRETSAKSPERTRPRTWSGARVCSPTEDITHTGQTLDVDGVRIVFQLTPETEAPAEMHLWFPELRALCIAENCTATMHNVLTLRGALVRDALTWTRSLDDALVRYGDEMEVLFASHGWPYWGRADAMSHLRNHRDLYRWIHDEAMRLANLGHT
ncbi:MAG: MBL fold metallo-hydrolase, partial [Actinobacteria bacterium]|nr:MBL fold metallo-hydrolase [Actinomycetota bacterium]